MTDPGSRKLRFSLVVRRVHLFAALFLTPWVLLYATSTLVMHHEAWFAGEADGAAPAWALVAERQYAPATEDAGDTWTVARGVLRDLDMEGAFSTSGSIGEGTLTIYRDRALQSYRVTVSRDAGTVRVERRRLDVPRLLEMLHRRRGYSQPFVPDLLWALTVDVVVLAILAWVASGLWMWWEMERTRKLGVAFAGVGSLAFVVLLLIL